VRADALFERWVGVTQTVGHCADSSIGPNTGLGGRDLTVEARRLDGGKQQDCLVQQKCGGAVSTILWTVGDGGRRDGEQELGAIGDDGFRRAELAMGVANAVHRPPKLGSR